MKRPLPPPMASCTSGRAARTLAALLLLVPACTARIDEEIAARKKGKEDHEANCVPLLTLALGYDADGSKGLDSEEWTNFWSSIADGDTEAATVAKGGEVYAALLGAQCDELDVPASFCDDTATTDEEVSSEDGEDEDEDKGDNNPFVFHEISLGDFDAEKPGKDMKGYHKQFCKDVTEALEVLEFGEEGTSSTVPATGSTEPASTESATSAATEAAVEVTVGSTVASTVASSTAAPETSTSTTTTSSITTTTSTSTAAATTAGPLSMTFLTFLGSTGGSVKADDAADDAAMNDVLDQVSHAFWTVGLDILEDLLPEARSLKVGDRRGLYMQFAGEIMELFEGVVMDVDDVSCPSDVAYAVEGSECLEFSYRLMPLAGGPLTQSLVDEFVSQFVVATDEDGELYDALIEEYPDTAITGLGSPGKGQPIDTTNPANINQAVERGPVGGDAASTSSEGLAPGAIVGIALAAALVALLLAAVVVRHRRNKRRQLDDSNLSEDMDANEISQDANEISWYDEEHGDNLPAGSPASSSLAAMGVASTVATRLTTGDTEIMLAEKQSWTKKEPVI